MLPYSFTPQDGTEYIIPQFRSTILDRVNYNVPTIEIPGATGAYMPNQYTVLSKMKPFTLSFSIYKENGIGLDTAVDAAMVAFNANGVLKVLMGDLSYRQQDMVINSVSRDWKRVKYGICDITVECNLFPYWLSTSLNSVASALQTFNVVATTNIDIINGLVITLLNTTGGVIQDIGITNSLSGSNITIHSSANGGLVAGDTITLDVGANYVWYASDTSKLNLRKDIAIGNVVQVALFKLRNGTNPIAVSKAGLTTTFSWRNTWL